jgi:UDP-N-acetylmuramoylalanine--D-glutamate ligase
VKRKISIIGAGISGIGAAKSALFMGYKVFLSDTCPKEKLEEELKTAGIFGKIDFEAEKNGDEIYNADLIVVSPSVPKFSPIFFEAQKHNVEVVGELEFAYQYSKCRWIAITGSTGKSTTTALINAIFDRTNIPHYLCGNIGISAAEFAVKLPKDGVAICEVSSFQLETIKKFKPDAAILLNLYPNHLDRHSSLEEYYSMKMRIFENMKNGLIIINGDDENVEKYSKEVANLSQNSVVKFTQDLNLTGIDFENMKLVGNHNKLNAAAAVITAEFFGIDKKIIQNAVNGFCGLEHRMEFCGDVNGVKFYNDSKSTTGESMLAAVRGFNEKSVHLIVGGKDKGVPFGDYGGTIKEYCKNVYAIGEAAKRIGDCWGEIVIQCHTLQNAVKSVLETAKFGDVVVLSPACASFDQFKNFEDRGEQFKKIVKNAGTA